MAAGCTHSLVNTYTICATVPTGLEHGALEECGELFGHGIRTSRSRGKIFFDLASTESVREVCQVAKFAKHLKLYLQLCRLRSVDKYSVLVADLKHLLVPGDNKVYEVIHILMGCYLSLIGRCFENV